MKSVIVYGPPGCGKTRNKKLLMMYFNLSKVQDEWSPGQDVPEDTLLLTTVPMPPVFTLKTEYVVCWSFEAALQAATFYEEKA